ncbi:periplakin-like [Protopterus annectens]|uniref:periplakin-like n=1 Tax=Protopterus annectens TaxID=7888 RepID=UPI001CFBE1EA|nr:periplakin-like [Protopterus annectens]
MNKNSEQTLDSTSVLNKNVEQLTGQVGQLEQEEQGKVNGLIPVVPSMNYSDWIREKQMQLNSMTIGNDLNSVTKQIEEHVLFHKEIEEIRAGNNENDDADFVPSLQVNYSKLISASKQRQHDLSSLRDYMSCCTNELYWTDDQMNENMMYDWSDQNLNYHSRQWQHENFIKNKLQVKEAAITKLHNDGEKMLAEKHPGNNVIKAHMEAVHAEWKQYLNLLICENMHLKYMKDYHKFYKDAKDIQNLLKKVDTDLKEKYGQEFNDVHQPELVLQDLDEQQKSMDRFADVVSSLQKRSLQVLPLKYRRETLLKPIPVEALCDYISEQSQIIRGNCYILQKKNGMNWEVTDSAGRKQIVPGTCFLIPPTDPEATALTDNIVNQYKTVKRKLHSSRNVLLHHYEDLKKEKKSVSPEDEHGLQCWQLLSGLDKIDNNLKNQEKAVSACICSPVDQSQPVQVTINRMQTLKDIATTVYNTEQEKTVKIQECEAFLAKSPHCARVPQLQNKVNEVITKHSRVKNLLNFAQEKLDAALCLEIILQKSRDILSVYENKVALGEAIAENILEMDSEMQDLASISSELKSEWSMINESEKNLINVKNICGTLASTYQEYCPDTDRQEAEVLRLNNQYENLSKHIDTRSQHLQKAMTAYNNYNKGFNDLNKWLDIVPNNEPRETDTLQQINTKLKNQKLLLTDISDKEAEMEKVSNNALHYQQAIKDYETEKKKMRYILGLDKDLNGNKCKKYEVQSATTKIKEEEAILAAKFTEVKAVNKQRLQNLQFVQNILQQKLENELLQEQHIMSNRAEKSGEDPWEMIQKMLDVEIQRRQQLEMEIKSTYEELLLLEAQRPLQSVTTKEVIKKVPDPQLEEEYIKCQQTATEEQRQNKALQNELEVLQLKLYNLENESLAGAQQYIVKEVVRIEKDRAQEDEVLRLKEEFDTLKNHKTVYEKDVALLQKHIAILTDEKNKELGNVTTQEIITLQNDPQLESEFKMLQEIKDKENEIRLQQEEEVYVLQEKLKRLEKEKIMAEERIIVKELLKVEKDFAVERDVLDLRRQYENELTKFQSMQREKTDLQRKTQVLEEEKARPAVQEKMREIIRPDPKAESEVTSLRTALFEQELQHKQSEQQLKLLQDELVAQKNRSLQTEIKEIIKEVIKYKTDPENESLLEKLREENVDKRYEIEKFEQEITQLRQEAETWKSSEPQVQVKEIVKEVLQYHENPNTKEEVVSLKAKLAEEEKIMMTLEREKAEIKEKIQLRDRELSQVKEKFVEQEIVKVEEDPIVKADCELIVNKISNELKWIDELKEEISKLHCRKLDVEHQLEELDKDRQAYKDAEFEIQRLQTRLTELEEKENTSNEKVMVKQTVVLQQDPQQEKEYGIIKLQLEEAIHKRQLIQNDLIAFQQHFVHLEKKEVKERVVFSEKVQVEKNPESESQMQRLKNSIEDEVKRKQGLNKKIEQLNAKLSEAEFTNAKCSKDIEYLKKEISQLKLENQSLQAKAKNIQLGSDMAVHETKDTEDVSEPDNLINFEARIASLGSELDNLKHISKEKDHEIEQLQKQVNESKTKRQQRENYLQRSIIVIDPDTGREMTPEEAYRLGLIDWNVLDKLQNQQCDWEETTITEADGETSVIHDRLSGKKFSIYDALNSGKISKTQLDQYYNKELSIQEFAILVKGEK